MKELEYPFHAKEILKKKKLYKRQLLADKTVPFLDKKIAILGGRNHAGYQTGAGAFFTALWNPCHVLRIGL